MLIKTAYDGWLVTPDLVLPSDYIVEADARQASSNASSYGLAFGIKTSGSAYETYQFLAYPNTQEYLLEKRTMDGAWHTLIDWTYSGWINSGTAANHLGVKRQGAAIYLYINSQEISLLYDSDLIGSGRDAGLRVYSSNDVPVDVRFDNFRVSCAP